MIQIKKEFFQSGKPKEKTLERLNKLSELGLTEISYGEFGIKGLHSGLYIEMIWNQSDEKFENYLTFLKELIDEQSHKIK